MVRVEEAKDLSGCHPEGAAAKHPEGALALKDVARGICFSRQKFGALPVPAAAGRRPKNGGSLPCCRRPERRRAKSAAPQRHSAVNKWLRDLALKKTKLPPC